MTGPVGELGPSLRNLIRGTPERPEIHGAARAIMNGIAHPDLRQAAVRRLFDLRQHEPDAILVPAQFGPHVRTLRSAGVLLTLAPDTLFVAPEYLLMVQRLSRVSAPTAARIKILKALQRRRSVRPKTRFTEGLSTNLDYDTAARRALTQPPPRHSAHERAAAFAEFEAHLLELFGADGHRLIELLYKPATY